MAYERKALGFQFLDDHLLAFGGFPALEKSSRLAKRFFSAVFL